MESPILIDVWRVDPARRDELVQLISAELERLVVPHNGFVSAEIYESTNGGMVLVNVRMQTARDRRELTDSADVQRAYRQARTLGRIHANAYRLVESFGRHGDPEVTKGERDTDAHGRQRNRPTVDRIPSAPPER